MRTWLLLLVGALGACGKDEPARGAVLINEIAPSNENGLELAGAFPDWIELYNPGEDEIDLGGWSLTDDLSKPDQWRFADGTAIQGGKYLVLVCDSDTGEGPTHTSFDLSKLGESIGLYDADGRMVDEVTFGPIATDYSWARMPDAEEHVIVWPPTPGGKNQLKPQPPGGAP